ncbi:MAG TPA: acetyl-CoA C-acyltransferase [Cytophagaceae bacterium]|jgi:acetyl-CoA C-acetyltransferase|nr:acetyl-CoA C-acyltransferase [Cytophagaceae bacterium]
MSKTVYILSAIRTPIGSFGGTLSSLSASQLGASAIKGALEKAGVAAEHVEEVYMGNVLSANLGQAPARQAAKFAGLPDATECTTINKVCASGSKAISLAALSILNGDAQLVIAGGMESMSNVPHYLAKARFGVKLGSDTLVDGLVKDGLWDVYNDYHMGNAAEDTAKEMNITREQQDAHAIASYNKSSEAWSKGLFQEEIIPIELPGKIPMTIDRDEEYSKVNFDKIPSLKPVFLKDGTVTAANASTLNDGAAAIVLASEEYVKKHNLKPIARLLAAADFAQAPERFTTSPAKAIPLAVAKAGLTMEKIDYFEINEAFSVVSIANNRLLKLPEEKINTRGGAVALGHPLGCSGARIVVTLLHVLKQNNAKYGATGICNGGGGATSLVFENLS